MTVAFYNNYNELAERKYLNSNSERLVRFGSKTTGHVFIVAGQSLKCNMVATSLKKPVVGLANLKS
jgi:hypothetical protein